jgi:hypothetical protein
MSATKEQTAVEFMLEGIINLTGVQIARDEIVVERANKMFMQQIMNAYNNGCIDILKDEMKLGSKYYNETFKTK